MSRRGDLGLARVGTPPAAPAWWRIGHVAGRNTVAVVGVLFLGWSASNLLVLYFADFVAGLWAVLTAVTVRLSGADVADSAADTLHGLATALVAGLFLAALVAVPFGLPLVFVLGPRSWSLRGALADPSFAWGLLLVALGGLVEAGRHCLEMRRGEAGERGVKQASAVLITRWLFVMLAVYAGAALLGRAAPYALVVVYAVASAWSELEPGRFAGLFPDRRPGGDVTGRG